MSRPSSTAPPGRAAKARCASISAARTSRHCGDHGGRLAHLARAQGRVVEIGEPQSPGDGDRRDFVVKIAVLRDQGGGGRAVEQPSVEMRQPVMRRDSARNSAFARGSGPVDGDDHQQPPASQALALIRALRARQGGCRGGKWVRLIEDIAR